MDVRLVTAKLGDFFEIPRIPEPDRVVSAGGGQAGAIGIEGDARRRGRRASRSRAASRTRSPRMRTEPSIEADASIVPPGWKARREM